MKNKWHVLPGAFLDRLKLIVSPDQYEGVIASYCSQKPTTLRVNTLKMTAPQLIKEFEALNIRLIPIKWWENGFAVEENDMDMKHLLTGLSGYKQGNYYVQSLSSMIPPLILDPQKGERVLDLCAAPGSKTTQIAALMQNTGEIIANDNSPIRVFKLKANLETQGVTNTKVIVGHGQTLWEKYPQYFDRVLVDVPCSMEGRFDCNDLKSSKYWSTRKIKELAERQRFLLRSAISCTKVGGTIVYSTCTLAPEENEGVIDWIVRREKDNVSVEDVQLKGFVFEKPVMKWNGKIFDEQVSKTRRILPGSLMEGFFIAKLRKIKSNLYG